MSKANRPEIIILTVMWLSSLISYSIALAQGYNLFISDYVGLAGLTLVTVIGLLRPAKMLPGLFFLLILGTLNLASFIYFVNGVFSFGFMGAVTPGIQLYSLLLIITLIVIRKREIKAVYRKYLGTTEEDKESSKRAQVDAFKRRFQQLSDSEIESKLNQGLVPEAVEALTEIKDERINALQPSNITTAGKRE